MAGSRAAIGWLAEDRGRLNAAFAIGTSAALPLAVFLFMQETVRILAIGGIVSAGHTPVIAALTWWLNGKQLPPELRAGTVMSAITVAAGVFYAAFAILYFADLLGIAPFKGEAPEPDTGDAERVHRREG